MPPKPDPWNQADTVAWTALLCIVGIILLAGIGNPVGRKAAAILQSRSGLVQTWMLAAADAYVTVATFDPKTRVLTLTDQVPADAVVCIAGQCRKLLDWIR